MLKQYFLISGLFALLTLGACAESAEVDYKAEIEAANDVFEEAFKDGDASALAALYTENSTITPPGMDLVTGADARTSLWQGLMDGGVAGVELNTDQVTGDGNLAAEQGHANLFDADGNVVGTIRYVVVWKKVEGVWKLHLDIWN